MADAGQGPSGRPAPSVAATAMRRRPLTGSRSTTMVRGRSGQARIRVQISAVHEKEHLDKAIAAFTKIGKDLGVLK